jgi:hypothetical protein
MNEIRFSDYVCEKLEKDEFDVVINYSLAGNDTLFISDKGQFEMVDISKYTSMVEGVDARLIPNNLHSRSFPNGFTLYCRRRGLFRKKTEVFLTRNHSLLHSLTELEKEKLSEVFFRKMNEFKTIVLKKLEEDFKKQQEKKYWIKNGN